MALIFSMLMGSIWTERERVGTAVAAGIFTRVCVCTGKDLEGAQLEATKQCMRWDGGGERVLYVEEGMVGHGKSGEEEEEDEV
jgi:hypothetical protein